MVENRLLAGFNHDNQSGRDAQYVTILESLRNGFRGGSSELAKTRGSGGGEVRIYSGAAPELIDFFQIEFHMVKASLPFGFWHTFASQVPTGTT